MLARRPTYDINLFFFLYLYIFYTYVRNKTNYFNNPLFPFNYYDILIIMNNYPGPSYFYYAV